MMDLFKQNGKNEAQVSRRLERALVSGDSTRTEIREPYYVCSRSCHREEMKAETFDGTSTDLQEYLSHFELVAKSNGWSRVEKGIQLAMSLRGAVQQVLGSLSNFEAEDYEPITAVLKKRFHPKERVPLYRYGFMKSLQGLAS